MFALICYLCRTEIIVDMSNEAYATMVARIISSEDEISYLQL